MGEMRVLSYTGRVLHVLSGITCLVRHEICNNEAIMDIFNIPAVTILSFLLTFMRVSIVMFLFPVFSSERIPAQVKAAVCIVVTLGIWPQVGMMGTELPAHPFNLLILFLGELVLGLVLGMCVNFVFMGIQAGGELFGFQMGFTMISFADPMTGNQTGITAFFLWMVAVLTFLALDGHLHMIQGFAISFKLVPAGGLILGELLLTEVLKLSNQLFVLALKIASPVMVSLFLVELTLALVNRTTPQINIMDIGFPAKIGAGFFFLGIILVLIAEYMAFFVQELDSLMFFIMRVAS